MDEVKKTKWIVLRGLGRGFGHWGSFQAKIKQQFSNDEFYFLDLPGNGLLNHETSPTNMADYVPAMIRQLNATAFEKTKGPVYGIGLSLGGMIITEWACQQPDFFTKIFLINTSSAGISKPWQRMSWLVVRNAGKQLFAKTIEDRELNSLLVTTGLTPEKIKKDFGIDYQSNIQFSKDHPISSKNIFRQMAAAVKYVFPSKIKTPAVIINGAGDRFVDPECSIEISQQWKAPLLTHPTAGHDIAFEDSDWLIEKIKMMTV